MDSENLELLLTKTYGNDSFSQPYLLLLKWSAPFGPKGPSSKSYSYTTTKNREIPKSIRRINALFRTGQLSIHR